MTKRQYKLGRDIDLDVEEVHDADGTRITEARAQEIAEQALAEVRRRGRPSLSGKHQSSPHVSFRLSAELREKAEQRAAREGTTVSTLARQALERYLAS